MGKLPPSPQLICSDTTQGKVFTKGSCYWGGKGTFLACYWCMAKDINALYKSESNR